MKRFTATLQRDGTALNWTIVKLPFDPVRAWPQRNRLRVRGTINGIPLRTSLFRMRKGHYFLLVNKPMQKSAGATLGSRARFELEPDLEERPVSTPTELEALLREDRALRKWHAALNESSRRWVADWVAQPKSAESRRRRAEQIVERMMLTMEGERVAPPVLQAAFQQIPKAREGWQAMTSLQRRQHLLGIFYCQSPDSRQKRVRKAMEDALRRAGKSQAPPSKRP